MLEKHWQGLDGLGSFGEASEEDVVDGEKSYTDEEVAAINYFLIIEA